MNGNQIHPESTCTPAAAASAPAVPTPAEGGHGDGQPNTCPPSHAEPQPARNRGGAPKGNVNRGKAFLRSTKWPTEAKADEGATLAIRVDVVEALEAKHGSPLPPAMFALVATLVRHEKRARLAERWLRVEKALPLADRLRLLDVIGAATESRDKVLRQLGLEVVPGSSATDPWAGLIADPIDSPPHELAASKALHSLANESDATPDQSANQPARTQPLATPLRREGITANGTNHKPQEVAQ
jgi:hypothetical protein